MRISGTKRLQASLSTLCFFHRIVSHEVREYFSLDLNACKVSSTLCFHSRHNPRLIEKKKKKVLITVMKFLQNRVDDSGGEKKNVAVVLVEESSAFEESKDNYSTVFC